MYSENANRSKTGLKLCLLVSALLLMQSGISQFTHGLTYERDTSFTNYSAFKKTIKSHPEISMPAETNAKYFKHSTAIFDSVNDVKLTTQIFQPLKNKNGITVIMLHGGGWRSGSPLQHSEMLKRLAVKGYTCFAPQYRLSTHALFPAALHDAKTAIKWVRHNAGLFGIDTSRIVIAGFSAGAQLATLTGVTGNMPLLESSRFDNISSAANAIINIDGTLSFVHAESEEGDGSNKKMASSMWLGYSRQENPLLWEIASPLSFAVNASPVLFINSSIDRMHAGRNDFIKILNSRNILNKVVAFENSPHSFCLFNPWLEPTVTAIDEFLKKVFLQ